MSNPCFHVDFNEMVEADLVLLSREDRKNDNAGNSVQLYEGMEVCIFMEDEDENGIEDNLIACGTVEKNRDTGWSKDVKWCCRVTDAGISHKSNL